jgi:hypothetical protein
MAAEAISTKQVGLPRGLRVFVGLGILIFAPACEVTAGPVAGSFEMDASTVQNSMPEAAAGDAASMASADPQTGPGGCPKVRPRSCPAEQAACTQVGANCVYDDWCCTCGDGMMQWYCAQTDAPDPCPKEMPEAGSRCDLNTVGCMYCTPQGLFTAACGNAKQITYYAPQCEATIPPPAAVVDAGSHGPPPTAEGGTATAPDN